MRELYAHGMHDPRWESLFEDLEHQFVSERERESGALALETERARIAELTLYDRVAGLPAGERLTIRDSSGETHRLILRASAPEWIACESEDARGFTIVCIAAIDELRIPSAARARSLASADPDPLRARMGISFVLRALARRRAVVQIGTWRGARHTGTLSRAGADHVDIAIHDLGSRANVARDEVTIAIGALAWIRTSDSAAIEL